VRKTDHTTTTNGVVSPTGNASGRTWRSPSPVYAYRTGWLPPSKPASRNAPPLTSPLSPQQHPLHHRGRVDANGTGTSGLHSTGFKSEQSSDSSPSTLKIDLTACDRQAGVRWQRAQVNGHVDSGMVNGCTFESKVASSSSPNQCDVVPASRSGNAWVAERNSSASSASVDSVDVLAKSPSSSTPGVVETVPVESLPASSKAHDASDSLAADVAADADNTVVVDHTSSCYSGVAVTADRGVDSVAHCDTVIPPCSSAPEAEVVEEHNEVVDGSTTTDVTDDVRQPSRDAVVTSSPLVISDIHRDSDLLLSARRTSVDYFQKVRSIIIIYSIYNAPVTN